MSRRTLRAALAAFALAAGAAPALAGDLALAANSGWQEFTVDSFLAPLATPLVWIDDSGNAIDYVFSVASGTTATLTVVDGGFAGDRFSLTNSGSAFATTSVVPVGTYESSPDVGTDFDAALGNAAFSRLVMTLAPGNYKIAGVLTQSVTLTGVDLDATDGGIRLDVTAAVPEPETYALFAAGIAVVGLLARRRGPSR